MTIAETTIYRFTRSQYDQMVEAGVLEGQPVELIDGEILRMSPINNPHVTACTLLTELLREAFGKGCHIRVQAPLAIGDSEPQPDIAVIAGSARDYTYHPSMALLVVEVSDTTVNFDRTTKASLYASAGIADYWLLNVSRKQLEVHRNPVRDGAQKFGHRYDDVRVYRPQDLVGALAAAQAEPIRVADMLP